MADPKHMKIVRQGKDVVDRWRSSKTDRLCGTLGYDNAEAKLDLAGQGCGMFALGDVRRSYRR